MSTFIDITRPLHNGTPPWPGDRAVDFKHVAKIRDGSAVNIGNLSLSVHNGTHADAPYHYNDSGATIDAIPVDAYIGPAQVIDVRGHATISIALLEKLHAGTAPRLLLHTGAWTNPAEFPTTWSVLDLDVPAWLAARGVHLIGLDAPSVDELTSKDLPRHLALDRANVLILENLFLEAADPGLYELIALPLRLTHGDGSPIRAVLRS
ncbi:cyclase family protein [Synoicihabitans lomoniglobus]|uniref:Kynurenine formamidase n=1 Tax=Synoicihabitans lomoniglobus TaxID=2909285 RepID=A0AAE9ZSY7_9BACT|nr:cyclase family protein [Opitutaceae bacterium LMO-M01]WED64635.1 cyclase family protein [Opitutaceae bacterium LMO-M01]